MMIFKSRFVLRLLPIVYMIIIWLQSSYFDPESIRNIPLNISTPVLLAVGLIFELAHLFEFGLLYLLLFLAFLSFEDVDKRKEVMAVAIAFSFGLIDEIHQIFIPFRSFSLSDLLKNAIGVLVMWWFIHKSYFTNENSRIGVILRKIGTSIE